jgi:5-deoxy-D-glucuronate isomerase
MTSKFLIPSKKMTNWSGTVMEVGPQKAGFHYLALEVRRLKASKS